MRGWLTVNFARALNASAPGVVVELVLTATWSSGCIENELREDSSPVGAGRGAERDWDPVGSGVPVPVADTGVGSSGSATAAQAFLPAGLCDSGWTGWTGAGGAATELHVVAVYESQDGRPGPVTVNVGRTVSSWVGLSSAEPVDWQVGLADNASVVGVIVTSRDPSTVTFAGPAVPVVDAGWLGACAYETPDSDPQSGCETLELEAALESVSGLVLSSFQGCYYGGTFAVEDG